MTRLYDLPEALMLRKLLSTLSAGQSRSALIASHEYGGTLAAPVKGDVDEADVAVSSLIDQAIAAQEADPDQDEADAQVLDLLKQAKAAQAQDDDAVVAAAGAPPKATPSEGGPADGPQMPVDEEGNVEDAHKCANPDCQHLASAHANTDTGRNTGACSVSGCMCPEMKLSHSEEEEGGTEAEGAGLEEDGNSPNVKASGAQPADAPPATGPVEDEEPDENLPPAVEGSEEMGPEFTIPVGVIEGQPTGDGREIAPDALSWRVPPLPLMGLKTETHDPSGFDMNDPAVMCGRIDVLERKPGEGATQVIWAKGFYLPNEDGMAFAAITEAMGRCGISADIAVEDSTVTVEEVDEIGFPLDMSELLTEGTIMGFTQVPFPAFQGAYVVLGDGTEQPEATAIPQQADAPQTPAEPPAIVAGGGQLLHLMAQSECEACDHSDMQVIVASGGPAHPPSAWFEDPGFAPDDGRLVEILGRAGEKQFACPLTVTADGEVFGHIAPWNVCHTGKPGQCLLAPRSASDYAHFKRGKVITTAEGTQVRCGTITADTGHAPLRTAPSSAMAHYDNTALQAADVNIGEDEYGIWVHGALRSGVTEQQRANLEGESVSGDWREIGGRLELVAALAVPMPGFPLAVVDHDYGQRMAMTATGALVMHKLKHPAGADTGVFGQMPGPLLRLSKRAAAEEIAVLR
jgi:hypothetical protein